MLKLKLLIIDEKKKNVQNPKLIFDIYEKIDLRGIIFLLIIH